jgi:hypothetical protein
MKVQFGDIVRHRGISIRCLVVDMGQPGDLVTISWRETGGAVVESYVLPEHLVVVKRADA